MLKQIDPQPSITLPPARLYLDDIEQIIQIFVDTEKERGERRSEEEIEILFQIGDQTTADIQDLAGIHPESTNDFEVEFHKGVGFSCQVRIYKSNTTWHTFGLTENERWGLFHKLDALFEARKLRWKKLLHTHSRVSNWIYGATSAVLFVALLSLTSRPVIPRALEIGFAVVLATLFVALRTGLGSHSIVIFRRRADHAVRSREGAMKAAIEILKLIVSFLFGVLALYLKHKYWP